ncbi:MAG: hypothetical protein GY927_25745 [bacterium]|nr:hypothetical protein [bacterium]
MYLLRGMYLSPNSEGGGSNGSGSNGDPNTGFNNLVQKQGSSDAAGILLYQENHSLRGKNRELETEIEKLKKKVPGKEAVILTDDQAQTWTAYQALGTPDEITAVQTNAKKFERKINVTAAAAVAKYSTDVLLHLAPENATFSTKQVQDTEGNQVQAAYIKVGEGNEVELSQYAGENWKPFLPSLTIAGDPQQQQVQGTRYIQQQGNQQPAKEKELTPDERKAKVKSRNRSYSSL